MSGTKTNLNTILTLLFAGGSFGVALLTAICIAMFVIMDMKLKPIIDSAEMRGKAFTEQMVEVKREIKELNQRFDKEVFSELEFDSIIGEKVASYMDSKNQKWFENQKSWYEKVKGEER